MKTFLKKLGRHFYEKQYWYICAAITLGLLFLGIARFPNAIGRLVESCRDFGLSVAYAFCDWFDIEPHFEITVNRYPDYSFLNVKAWLLSLFRKPFTPSEPSTALPSEWSVFKQKWVAYWRAFIDTDNMRLYVLYILYYLSVFASIVLFVIPLWFAAKKLFDKYYFKEKRVQENAENAETPETNENAEVPRRKESKPLRVWHTFYFSVVARIKLWFIDLFDFIRSHAELYQFWLLLACLYCNVLTIFLEFCAYYIYFSVSFDFINLYRQAYKLILDLQPFVRFMPLVGWIVLAYILLEKFSRKIGYDRLAHNERKNRGFINELGLVTYIYAAMGEGKTTMLTSMALSNEVQLRDDALEVIFECDLCFPHFPWSNLENALKAAYTAHEVYDKWSCIRFIKRRQEAFLHRPSADTIFGYDIEKYPVTFDNKLYVEDIWQTIQDYALAYTIYTTQSALIVSNYSIRVDDLMRDLGNFPLWDSDFFHRDSRLVDSFSRHSHILDYDMLRIGKQMLEDNPNRYAFGWGVWVITELDKEAKNTLEQQEMKMNDEECNPKNDLMHVLFKMSRHACMIRHRNFVRILADMQRVENITANLRQIGQVALIAEKGEKGITLPFFAPYKLFSPIALSLKSKLDNLYVSNRYLRADERLITNGIEKLRSIIGVWDLRTENTFGCRCLQIELQTGRMDGQVRNCKYYIQDKKDYAKRNGSDCLAGIFASRGARNTVGLCDMAEYADYIATQDELLQGNSHWQKEIKRYETGVEMKRETDIKAVDKFLSSAVEGLMAIQNGKIKATEETSQAAQTLVKSLCGVVSEWAEEPPEEDSAALSG